jgi:hypothetical protein
MKKLKKWIKWIKIIHIRWKFKKKTDDNDKNKNNQSNAVKNPQIKKLQRNEQMTKKKIVEIVRKLERCY